MVTCDDSISVMDNVTIKMTNTLEKNVVNTFSINCHCKKVRDYYILQAVLLAKMLLLIITSTCHHYAKQKMH